MTKKNIALIDGDIVVYQAGFASDQRYYSILDIDDGHREVARFQYKKDADEYVVTQPERSLRIEKGYEYEPLENCLHSVKLMVENIKAKTKSNGALVFLSGKSEDNFRMEIDKEYKANRDASHKPHWTAEIRQYLVSNYGALVTSTIEADDAIGIEHNNLIRLSKTLTPIICSLDKDLLTIPGRHYNWRKDEFTDVSELEAAKNFWRQMLTGDTVDNIKGVPKIGKVKAARLIDHLMDEDIMKDVVVSQYQVAFPSTWKEEYAKNYHLLYILRDDSDAL